MKTVRVPFDKIAVSLLSSPFVPNSPFYPLDPFNPGTPLQPGTIDPSIPLPPGSTNQDTSDDPQETTATAVALSLTTIAQTPSSMLFSRYEYPCRRIAFSFPVADFPRVNNWYTGSIEGLTDPSSPTLISNLNKALTTLIAEYQQICADRGLITAPMRIGTALRRNDGKHIAISTPTVICTGSDSPLLIARDTTLSETSVESLTEIHNTPLSPRISLKIDRIPDDVTHVEIVATRPVSLIPSNPDAEGLNTYMYQDTRTRSYTYRRYDADTLSALAAADTDLRIVASIPIDQLPMTDAEIPFTAGWYDGWKNLPKVTAASTSGSGSGNSGNNSGDSGTGNNNGEEGDSGESGLESSRTWPEYLHMVTEPLDLGLPDSGKRVSALYLRGIFERSVYHSEKDEYGVTVRLYGSMHRERWHLIATAHCGEMHPLHTPLYRWYCVAIDGHLRRSDTLDAVTLVVR